MVPASCKVQGTRSHPRSWEAMGQPGRGRGPARACHRRRQLSIQGFLGQCPSFLFGSQEGTTHSGSQGSLSCSHKLLPDHPSASSRPPLAAPRHNPTFLSSRGGGARCEVWIRLVQATQAGAELGWDLGLLGPNPRRLPPPSAPPSGALSRGQWGPQRGGNRVSVSDHTSGLAPHF